MSWKIIYHQSVDDDLKSIGPSAAKRILQVIDKRLSCAPDNSGAPLANNLKNFRKLRAGDFRIVYQIQHKTVVVFVLAVGPRRDKEIYRSASLRSIPQ